MPLTVSRTTAFRRLQSRIGSSTYQLNTLFVGLKLIAEGGGEGGAIAVTWTKPPTVESAEQTANQARAFACRGALVLAADVFDSFLRNLVSERWLSFCNETREIATKAKTRPKHEGGDYSVAERAAFIGRDLGISEPVKISALDLLVKWRNNVVHDAEQSRRLRQTDEVTLRNAADHFRQKYSHFDIELAIRNFNAQRIPVAKEVTSLIAAAVNLARIMDEHAIRRMADSAEKLCIASEEMLRGYFAVSAYREANQWREICDAWQGGLQRRRNAVKKYWSTAGLTENQSPISAELPHTFLEELITLPREEFARRVGVTIPE